MDRTVSVIAGLIGLIFMVISWYETGLNSVHTLELAIIDFIVWGVLGLRSELKQKQ